MKNTAKKGLLVLVLAALVAVGAFALPDFRVSVVGGMSLDLTSGFPYKVFAPPPSGAEVGSIGFKIPLYSFGGFVFFDITYAELSIAFGGGSIETESKSSISDQYDDNTYWDAGILTFGLMGKFPFQIGSSFALFPMLGFDYMVVLSPKYDSDRTDKGAKKGDTPKNTFKDGAPDITSELNSLRLKAGLGGDISFTNDLYLRINAIVSLRLPSKYENDDFEGFFGGDGSNGFVSGGGGGGLGFTLALGLGYRF